MFGHPATGSIINVNEDHSEASTERRIPQGTQVRKPIVPFQLVSVDEETLESPSTPTKEAHCTILAPLGILRRNPCITQGASARKPIAPFQLLSVDEETLETPKDPK